MAAANILYKHSPAADKGCYSSLHCGQRANISSLQKLSRLRNISKYLGWGWGFLLVR